MLDSIFWLYTECLNSPRLGNPLPLNENSYIAEDELLKDADTNEAARFERQRITLIAKNFDHKCNLQLAPGCIYISSELFTGNHKIKIAGEYYNKEYANIRLDLERDFIYGNDDKKQLAKRILSSQYKIHLMFKPEYKYDVLVILLEYFKKKFTSRNLVSGIKLLYAADKVDEHNMIIPHCVIYAALGKENTELLIWHLTQAFKSIAPYMIYSGPAPRFSLKVQDWLFYTQGDSCFKTRITKELLQAEFVESGVYFKSTDPQQKYELDLTAFKTNALINNKAACAPSISQAKNQDPPLFYDLYDSFEDTNFPMLSMTKWLNVAISLIQPLKGRRPIDAADRLDKFGSFLFDYLEELKLVFEAKQINHPKLYIEIDKIFNDILAPMNDCGRTTCQYLSPEFYCSTLIKIKKSINAMNFSPENNRISRLDFAVTASEYYILKQLDKDPTLLTYSNHHGQTLLHIAVLRGNYAIVSKILDLGANHKSVTKSGNSAFILAIMAKHLDIACLLYKKSMMVKPEALYKFKELCMAEARQDIIDEIAISDKKNTFRLNKALLNSH